MKFAILLAAALLGASAFADRRAPAVKCDVETEQDAKACMEKVAEARPSFEEPNEGYATARVGKLVEAVRVLGLRRVIQQQAAAADFAGMMLEHGDEHHIYYFSIKKGKDVSPKELYDLNIVDFEYILDKPYSVEALDHNTYFLGISEAQESDVYEDVAEALRYLAEDQGRIEQQD